MTGAGPRHLRIATRGSALAQWQAGHVAALVADAAPGTTCELVVVTTAADQRLATPIWELGGKGAFCKEVQAAVLDGRADLAVHSAKDLPSATPVGLLLAAVPTRADARDVLVGSTLDGLPPGAVVGTGSMRRRVQLAQLRGDLTFEGLRGNIATRLERAGEFGAIVVAKAALDRLGLSGAIAEVLEVATMVPQVGQGALAVECRADDGDAVALARKIEDADARCAVDAERAFLETLGGDCDLPAGAHAIVDHAAGAVRLTGILATPDHATVHRSEAEAGLDEPAAAGRDLARVLRALAV